MIMQRDSFQSDIVTLQILGIFLELVFFFLCKNMQLWFSPTLNVCHVFFFFALGRNVCMILEYSTTEGKNINPFLSFFLAFLYI